MKLNENTSCPSAFISSTFLDLQAERRKVAAVLENAGLNVNALDVKPASTSSSKLEILSGIRECDFKIKGVRSLYLAMGCASDYVGVRSSPQPTLLLQ